MEAEQILTHARAEEILVQARAEDGLPEGWLIFPLLRRKVVAAILGWIGGIIMGLGLFGLIASVVIPSNYQHGQASAIFTTVLLGIFLFIGLGSIYLAIVDIQRLRNASQHIIVITPEDFVKQEGKAMVHVPLADVRHVTARGLPPPDRNVSSPENQETAKNIPGAGEGVMGFFFGRGIVPSGQRWRRKRMRTPTSLAFIDRRSDKEVTVVSDGAYGDSFGIAAVLKQYAASVQKIVL